MADWLAPCVRLGDTATAWTSERLLCGDEGKDLSEDWVAGPFFGVDDLALFAGDVMLDPSSVSDRWSAHGRNKDLPGTGT